MRLKQEEQKIFIVIILAAIILSVVFYNLSFKPRLKKLRSLAPQVSKLNKDLRMLKKDLANIENLKRQLHEARQKTESDVKRFLTGNDLTPLMEEFSRLAKTNRVKIVNISPVKTKDSSSSTAKTTKPTAAQSQGTGVTLTEMPVSINVKGGYHNIGKFINALENSKLFIKVIDIDINTDYDDPLNHNASLLVSAYALTE